MKAIVFSPTGGTKKYAEHFLSSFETFHLIDITKKEVREKKVKIERKEPVLIAFPVYGGRVPVIVMEFLLRVAFQDNTFIVLATYGNREFDDALLEMNDFLKSRGVVVAAGAFIAAHSYSEIVAKGRPNVKDLKDVEIFAKKAAQKLKREDLTSIKVPGKFPYKESMPKPTAKPKTDLNTCIDCKKCVAVCPMEIIHYEDVSVIDDGCINCCACVKICPKDSKYFDAERIVMFKEILETKFLEEKRNKTFF